MGGMLSTGVYHMRWRQTHGCHACCRSALSARLAADLLSVPASNALCHLASCECLRLLACGDPLGCCSPLMFPGPTQRVRATLGGLQGGPCPPPESVTLWTLCVRGESSGWTVQGVQKSRVRVVWLRDGGGLERGGVGEGEVRDGRGRRVWESNNNRNSCRVSPGKGRKGGQRQGVGAAATGVQQEV